MRDQPEHRKPNPQHKPAPAQPVLPRLDTPRHTWHVVEIEGEATAVEAQPTSTEPLVAHPQMSALQDIVNDLIVVSLDTRHLCVAVGETALFRLSVLNNGDRQASFEVTVEGAINEAWVVITANARELSPALFSLNPGEHSQLSLAITPPRAPQSAVGDHPIRVIVRAAAYAGAVSQLNAQLTIAPYTDFTLGELRPRQLFTSWRQRQGEALLPLTNRSNHPVTFMIHPRVSDPTWRCTVIGPNLHKVADGPPQLTLPPSKRMLLTVQVMHRAVPWFGLTKRGARIQFVVAPVDQPQMTMTANLRLYARPIFGVWHALTLVVLGICAGLGIIALTVAATVLALRSTQPPAVVSQPVANPPISIVVNLAQPAPPAAALSQPQTATPLTQTLTANVVNLPAEQPNPNPSIPVVRVDQISNPGAASRPAFVAQTTPLTSPQSAIQNQQSPVTYQQMFQEIALHYDLNWRVLAAQAYIESGFDSLALGKQGDMGLMQIMPATWHEWAPVVNATDPFDGYSNVLVAAVYLDHLRTELGKKGYPQTEWMLVAYNWGIDKVLDHLAAGQGWEDLPTNRRQYALDILRIAETIPPG